jgi:nucleoside diphosphate kinase
MSVPSSSPTHLTGQDGHPVHLASLPRTRTVAIVKKHALHNRLDIEPRIFEAGFEIVKERQMEFDMESDPEVMYDLFGDDAACFAEGPVRVYVLERRGAVEVWQNLMGPADPEVARQHQPDSLRALYGTSIAQNAVMGSPDNETAEIQIASLFASSPPFPATDLPDGSIRSLDSSVLGALQESASSELGYPQSTATNPSTVGGTKRSRPSFKARPLPSTHVKPDIVPRTTRSAALRAGMPVEKKVVGPRRPLSKEALAKTFANVPGHKRAETIVVASTAPPVIAPRMTRAASLRLGQKPPPKPVRSTTSDTAARTKPLTQGTFEGVPGHKRRETISVASTKVPVVTPRTNRSAALRAMKDHIPPSSFRGCTPPAISRTPSNSDINRRTRPASVAGTRLTSVLREANTNSNVVRGNGATKPTRTSRSISPAKRDKPKPRPSSFAAPTIAPRMNKSAALRAAKMTATNESVGKQKVPRKSIPAFV